MSHSYLPPDVQTAEQLRAWCKRYAEKRRAEAADPPAEGDDPPIFSAGELLSGIPATRDNAPQGGPDGSSLDDAIIALARLSRAEYDRVRTREAARLGVRVATLDAEVARARRAAAREADPLPTVEPSSEAVPLAKLLDAAKQAILRHVYIDEAAAAAVALWAAHTWTYERFEHTPRLHITAPTKRCGKSTLCDLIASLSRRPLRVDSVSAAALFRAVESLSPLTVICDEADTYLTGDDDALRGIINSGYHCEGAVIRVEEVNGARVIRRFRTFAPVLLAGIGAVPDTIADRSIPIRLDRRPADHPVAKLRACGAREALRAIAAGFARWALDGPDLDPNPPVPDAFNDRQSDIAVPLLSVAKAAGPAWGKAAERALIALFRGQRDAADGEDIGVLLLADLHSVFAETGAARLSSAEICDRLGAFEHRPWPEYRNGKPITPPQLARVLSRFGVRPQNFRRPDGGVRKGYLRGDLEPAWERYLPPSAEAPPSQAATPL